MRSYGFVFNVVLNIKSQFMKCFKTIEDIIDLFYSRPYKLRVWGRDLMYFTSIFGKIRTALYFNFEMEQH